MRPLASPHQRRWRQVRDDRRQTYGAIEGTTKMQVDKMRRQTACVISVSPQKSPRRTVDLELLIDAVRSRSDARSPTRAISFMQTGWILPTGQPSSLSAFHAAFVRAWIAFNAPFRRSRAR